MKEAELRTLNEKDYNRMVNLFINAASEDETEREKVRNEIKKYGFLRFEEYFYLFGSLKQETKDNIQAIKALVAENTERRNEKNRP